MWLSVGITLLVAVAACLLRAATSAPVTRFEGDYGPVIEYRLVCAFFNKPIYRCAEGENFFKVVGVGRGPLIRSISMGRVMYHHPSDFLQWKRVATK